MASDEKNKIANARLLANKVTLGRLTSRIEKEPAADLSSLLKQQAESYPRLISILSKRKKTTDPEHHEDSSGRKSPSSNSPLGSLYISSNSSIHIIEPLSNEIIALANLDPRDSWVATQSNLPEILVAPINSHIRDGEILHRLHNTFVVSIGPRLAVKISPSLDIDQITNLKYIQKNVPDIPVPQCHGAFNTDQFTYLFMDRAMGNALNDVWPRLTHPQKASVQSQLTAILQSLRELPPENHAGKFRLGGFKSGACKDMRRRPRQSQVPTFSETEFNDFLCNEAGRTVTPWIRMVRSFMAEDHRIVATHADLHPRNIMVTVSDSELGNTSDAAVQISSIIDWEVAGWYPEYWEFVKAITTIDSRGPLSDWVDYLPIEAIGQYPVEYSIDSLIGRWLG